MNRPDSTAKNMPKIAELNLSSCGLEVADLRKNCDCGIAELRLQSNISSNCGVAMADSKKVARGHLCELDIEDEPGGIGHSWLSEGDL
jgi:hypothetical protein